MTYERPSAVTPIPRGFPYLGLWTYGICHVDMIPSTTFVTTENLEKPLVDVYNSKFLMKVIWNSDNPGAAPEGETRRVIRITYYTEEKQTFEVEPFSADVGPRDRICIYDETLGMVQDIEDKLDHQEHGLEALKVLIDAIEEKLGNPETGLNALEAKLDLMKGSQLFCLDFWSDPQEEVSVTSVAGDKAMPSVTVANLPAGAVIVRAVAIFKFRMVHNTNANNINKLSGAQNIQLRDDTPGTWRNAINLVDDLFAVAADTREGGDVLIGGTDISVEVDENDTYEFRWAQALADQDNLNFNDVQTGLRIWYRV
jgi:hypothetical protein